MASRLCACSALTIRCFSETYSDACDDGANSRCSSGSIDIPLDGNLPQSLTIEQGCYGSGSCSGSVTYSYSCATSSSDTSTPAPSPTFSSEWDSSTSSDYNGATRAYNYGVCGSFTASGTASATVSTDSCTIQPPATYSDPYASCTLSIFTCGCQGDTYMRVWGGAYELGHVDDTTGACAHGEPTLRLPRSDDALLPQKTGTAATVSVRVAAVAPSTCRLTTTRRRT
jgi:hypothetical protein